MSDKLTPKEAEFVRQYLLTRNGAEAVRRAKYQTKYPDKMASQLLGKTRVRLAIEEGERKVQEKFEIKQEQIIEELAAIAFGNIGMVLDWEEGNVSLKDKADMSPMGIKFIDSIKFTKTYEDAGTDKEGNPKKLEVVDLKVTTLAKEKNNALEKLGKHIGMWKDGKPGADRRDRKAILERLSQHLRKRVGGGGGGGST